MADTNASACGHGFQIPKILIQLEVATLLVQLQYAVNKVDQYQKILNSHLSGTPPHFLTARSLNYKKILEMEKFYPHLLAKHYLHLIAI